MYSRHYLKIDGLTIRPFFSSRLHPRPLHLEGRTPFHEFFTTPTLAALSTRPFSMNPFCCV